MRIVTTEKGKTTTLDGNDLRRIERLQLTLRVLAQECPLIPAYKVANEALENVAALFGQPRKIIQTFIVTEEEGSPDEQPASGEQQPDPTQDSGRPAPDAGSDVDPTPAVSSA